jgi:hypothetical protein
MARPNNSTGVKGITIAQSGKFIVQKKLNGISRYLGTFATIEEAKAAYDSDGRTRTGPLADFNGHDKIEIVKRGDRYSVRFAHRKGKSALIAIMDNPEDAKAIARQYVAKENGSARCVVDMLEPPAIGTPIKWKKRIWRVVGVTKVARNGKLIDIVTWADGRGQVGISGLKSWGLQMIQELV